ncbi:zinc finger protein STAR3-like [Malania oleifera]|uniref:zinc finger protein STAR3-like n=1 Tax=Malania oleifera TaxID=397392 RepID=UPI0025AEC0B4|nr:zinc finger protein STAR3-like [Malania oleifera]
MGEETCMNQMWESIATLKRSQEEQQITQAEQQKLLITVTQQLGALSDAVKLLDRAEAETLAFQAEIILCELISNSSDDRNKISMKGEAVNEEAVDEMDSDDQCEIMELDAKESLVEHIQFYEICGKGFHRDVKLIKRMRAYGNQLTTPEALAKLPSYAETKKTRFSHPFQGCNHIKSHYLVLGLISLMKS